MKENEMIIKTSDGKEIKYEIVLVYKSLKNDAIYIVFTDNKVDLSNNTNLFAKRYNTITKTLEDVTDEEWEEIKQVAGEQIFNRGDENEYNFIN